MINEEIKDIVEAELRDGEKLLWSHVMSHDEPFAKTGMNSKILRLLSKWHKKIIMLAYAIYVMWHVIRTPYAEIVSMLETQLPIFGVTLVFLILLMVVLHKTNFLQKLEETTRHLIYGSCIITDRRVVLFNHHDPARQEYTPKDITDVHLDYENGSRALRFKPKTLGIDAVLIGIADFEAALAVLRPYRGAA